MDRPDPYLVRCASCGHNFETTRFGELTCPFCQVHIWLEPPEGFEPAPADERALGPESPQEPDPDSQPKEEQEEEPEPEPEPESDQEPASDSGAGTAPDPPDSVFEAPDGLVRKAVAPPWEVPGPKPLSRLASTLKLALLQPGAFFASLPLTGYRRAFVFGWILATIGVFFFCVYGLWQLDVNRQAFLDLLKANADLEKLGHSPEQILEIWRSALTLGLFAAPLFGAVCLWVSAGLNHLGVVLVAGRGRHFEASFRATAYALAPLLLLVVPAVGNLVGGFWVIVLQVIAIGLVHRLSMGRATLAVLLPAFSAMLLLFLTGP